MKGESPVCQTPSSVHCRPSHTVPRPVLTTGTGLFVFPLLISLAHILGHSLSLAIHFCFSISRILPLHTPLLISSRGSFRARSRMDRNHKEVNDLGTVCSSCVCNLCFLVITDIARFILCNVMLYFKSIRTFLYVIIIAVDLIKKLEKCNYSWPLIAGLEWLNLRVCIYNVIITLTIHVILCACSAFQVFL